MKIHLQVVLIALHFFKGNFYIFTHLIHLFVF